MSSEVSKSHSLGLFSCAVDICYSFVKYFEIRFIYVFIGDVMRFAFLFLLVTMRLYYREEYLVYA